LFLRLGSRKVRTAMQPANGPGQPPGGPMRPPPSGVGVGVWQVPALVFCAPMGPQMPMNPDGFVVCENWGPQGFGQFAQMPFQPQPQLVQSFDQGMAQSSAAAGGMPVACMQRPMFDGYQDPNFAADASSSSGWPAAKDWQDQPMAGPNFQPVGFVGVGPPGPMPAMEMVPVPQMPPEPQNPSLQPADTSVRPFRPPNNAPWRRNLRSGTSSSQSSGQSRSNQDSWNAGPVDDGVYSPGPGDELCYGEQGPCACEYCEHMRSLHTRHFRGRRPTEGWEAPLPCGLLPSDVGDLLFRDIVPEDYDMLLRLDDGLEKRVASTEGVDALPSAGEEDYLGQNCTVCLAALERGEDVAKLPCTHVFHRSCVAKWLTEQKRACPLCNEEI